MQLQRLLTPEERKRRMNKYISRQKRLKLSELEREYNQKLEEIKTSIDALATIKCKINGLL